MSLILGDNFKYQGAKPLDGRINYNTLADMKAVADATMYDGCIAYCKGTDKTYQWKSDNTVDADLGKWREWAGGGSGGASDLSDLSDVNLAEPTDGQVLTYDAETGKWVNANGGSASIDELGDIGDVDLGTVTDGQVIAWDAASSKWVNGDLPAPPTVPSDIEDLDNVEVTDPANGQMLVYDSNSAKWKNANGGGQSASLSGLTDTDIENPSNGQVLKYNASNQAWENANESSSGQSIINGYAYTQPAPSTPMDYINWVKAHTDKTINVPSESIFSGKTCNCFYMVLAPNGGYFLFSESPFTLKTHWLKRSSNYIYNSSRWATSGTDKSGYNSGGTFTYANGITQCSAVTIKGSSEVDCDYLLDTNKEAIVYYSPNVSFDSSNNAYANNEVRIENTLKFYTTSAHTTEIPAETGKIYVDVPTGDMYEWNGTAYVKLGGQQGSTTLSGLTDTNISSPANNQFLRYNATTQKWVNAAGDAVAHLNDITDVNITNIADGQMIAWDAATSKWKNVAAPSGTTYTAGSGIVISEQNEITTDKMQEGDMADVIDSLPTGGRQIVAGFTPIGTVIAVMGTTAPQHYLPCNGQVVNIADYPELADYFEEQFGTKNHFGGDGTTTFAICDLRGEFLRGTGTNSHTLGDNGASVGSHQPPTEVPASLWLDTGNAGYPKVDTNSSADIPLNGVNVTSKTNAVSMKVSSAGALTNQTLRYYAVHPTNTSVLYCIATKDIYLDPRLNFSTDEKVVGEWIDQKPLYQKTITVDVPQCETDGTVKRVNTPLLNLGISDSIYVKNIQAIIENPNNFANGFSTLPQCSITDYMLEVSVWISGTVGSQNLCAINRKTAYNGRVIYVTLQYTKATS